MWEIENVISLENDESYCHIFIKGYLKEYYRPDSYIDSAQNITITFYPYVIQMSIVNMM